jgi:hypothetical protein
MLGLAATVGRTPTTSPRLAPYIETVDLGPRGGRHVTFTWDGGTRPAGSIAVLPQTRIDLFRTGTDLERSSG